MQTEKIREKFIQFFEQKGHKHVAAAPIVNKEDPSLLFTNSGMNQFKGLFLDHQQAPYQRAISIQPCLRVSGKHNDLEEVGLDTYHHTMFEMLGNWSFGDYFKEKAIQWAWELLTEVYQLPQERLYVTIFGGDVQEQLPPDHEAQSIWQRYTSTDKVLPYAKQDNFWEMGDTGPCGPCTEIHIDLRPEIEREQVPGKDLVNTGHPQVIELWNLVFIQYNRLANGQLKALSAKHVDTGMGLERLAMVLQGKYATYDTDLFGPLIQAIAAAAGKAYGQKGSIDTAMRVIADHMRAVTFTIADGQPPSNIKAGYVIRRILRRAVRYGYTYLGFEAPFMHRLVNVLAVQMQASYPHIQQQQAYIEKIVKEEEEAFFKTLTAGLHKLDQITQALQGNVKVIDGTTAFELYDTYGFPLDLTMLIAKERGLQVDEAGFTQALQAQRNRSKKAAVLDQGDWVIVDQTAKPTFIGYDQLEATAQVTQYRTAKAQDKLIYQIVLDQTPFYPQGGGQVGDIGQLITATGEKIAVLDTKKENDQIVHYTDQLPQSLATPLRAVVDQKRRMLTANNHSAIHLLHAALKQILGPHVEQRGSLVDDRMLRFDFSHASKLSQEEINQIECLVNEKIRANIILQEQRKVPLQVAKSMGATALFGEKYGEYVRVVTFEPGFSTELCGGTHVPTTGKIGFFKIVNTTAVAAGVRRIEAVTAVGAEAFVKEQLGTLNAVKELFKHPKDLEKAVAQLLQEKIALNKTLANHEAIQIQAVIDQLRMKVQTLHGIQSLIAKVELPHAEALKQVAFALKGVEKETSFFLVLAASIMQKPYVAVMLSKDLANNWAQNAQDIVKLLAQPIQGGGGGNPTFATAGGKELAGLDQVLIMAENIFYASLKSP